MKKFIQKLKEIWSIDELRVKIKNTLLFLLIYRIGTFIILPGIDGGVLLVDAHAVVDLEAEIEQLLRLLRPRRPPKHDQKQHQKAHVTSMAARQADGENTLD